MRTVVLAVALGLIATGCTGGPPAGVTGAPAATDRPLVGAGSLGTPRAVHRATSLPGGAVLFTGGCSAAGCGGVAAAATTARYDPATGAVTAGPRLTVPRLSHTATLLPDGRVLVAGGRDAGGTALGDTELLAPDGTVAAGPPLPEPRTAHTATVLGSRLVLVGGTATADPALAGTAVLDVRTRRWSAGPRLSEPRVKHAAVALPDGRLLVIGGSPDAESAELYADTEVLAGGRFRAGPALDDGRYKLSDAVAVLPDGRVLVAGGPTLLAVDVAAGTVRPVPGPALDGRRSFQTVSLLPGGRALVAGGYDSAITPTAQLWLFPIA